MSLSLDLLVVLLLAGLLLAALQLLSGLDLTALAQLGLSLRVQLGEKKLGLHVAQEKRQALHGEMDFVR